MSETIKVKNRSDSSVIYKIDEDKVRREFAPGEIKDISRAELEKVLYMSGGKQLLEEYLLVLDEDFVKNRLHFEPEYWLTEVNIKDLCDNGSIEQFTDCLVFAPEGVKDLIKRYGVQAPIIDVRKRELIKKHLNFDITATLRNIEEENMPPKSTPREKVPAGRLATPPPAPASARTVPVPPEYKLVDPQK